MTLLDEIAERRNCKTEEQRYSLEEYFNDAQFSYGGVPYGVVGGAPSGDVEQVENSFTGYVRSAYKSNGIVFGCNLARMMIFSEARFQFQRLIKGQPGELFSNQDLGILEKPWPNGGTGELLSRMMQDGDLAGNFYGVRKTRTRLRRLRPDWVQIVMTGDPAVDEDVDVAGYIYRPGGAVAGDEATVYLPEQMVHWSPIPDPEAQYRGMSWLTPVMREISADKHATEHKLKFFTNGATLSSVISLKETVTKDQFQEFVKAFNQNHQGTGNAYRNLVVGGGADVTLVGSDMRQLDFKATQGAGETRIAQASGVHPVILGLSEGMQGSSLNQGNFSAGRRLTADKTMRPLWRSACSALSNVINVPADARLWIDDKDIAFLREDRKDLAEIQAKEAITIRQLVDAGYTAVSVIAAVKNQDWSLLEHSGLFSVQLQPAGQKPTTPAAPDDSDGDE